VKKSLLRRLLILVILAVIAVLPVFADQETETSEAYGPERTLAEAAYQAATKASDAAGQYFWKVTPSSDPVKCKGGVMASSSVGGLSGAFIPVSEDAGMIAAARAGALSIEKLEAMTAVCSVGLDMIVIPGDTPASTISAIIADEAAIGMVNSKTTAVRVIPAIGIEEGQELEFGGLLGSGPVMKVRRESSDVMISRGGRIPAPIQSLKN
jgi:hypothetical protein